MKQVPKGWHKATTRPKKSGVYKQSRLDLINPGMSSPWGWGKAFWNGKKWEKYKVFRNFSNDHMMIWQVDAA